MKKLFLASIALFVLNANGSALAADMPVKAPVYRAPPPVAVYSWSGCYLGGNLGSGWASTQWHFGGVEFADHRADGLVGGVQIGCDYQAGAWVFGVQGMFDWSDLEADSHRVVGALGPNVIDQTRISSLATLTGRIGYAVRPATLLYVKGGAAWVRAKHDECCLPIIPPVTVDDGFAHVTRSGWAVGVGLEHMFRPNWSVFVEYDYIGLGERAVTFAPTGPTTGPFVYDIRQNVQMVLVGINVRLGPAAVVARY
jgi:outer membrane immunogenic protein